MCRVHVENAFNSKKSLLFEDNRPMRHLLIGADTLWYQEEKKFKGEVFKLDVQQFCLDSLSIYIWIKSHYKLECMNKNMKIAALLFFQVFQPLMTLSFCCHQPPLGALLYKTPFPLLAWISLLMSVSCVRTYSFQNKIKQMYCIETLDFTVSACVAQQWAASVERKIPSFLSSDGRIRSNVHSCKITLCHLTLTLAPQVTLGIKWHFQQLSIWTRWDFPAGLVNHRPPWNWRMLRWRKSLRF